MPSFTEEFLLVAGLHLLAVASPGPDFALVLRQSLVAGRRAALLSSLGIGSAILVHSGYSLLGVGVLLRTSDLLHQLLKWGGAAYLVWLAVQCLRARPLALPAAEKPPEPAPTPGSGSGDAGVGRGAWLKGFLTNLLNPKAAAFFLALFSSGLSPETPRTVLAGYGLWMALATAAWFCAVSLLFTRPGVTHRFRSHAHWIDRATGLALLAFAARLVWS